MGRLANEKKEEPATTKTERKKTLMQIWIWQLSPIYKLYSVWLFVVLPWGQTKSHQKTNRTPVLHVRNGARIRLRDQFVAADAAPVPGPAVGQGDLPIFLFRSDSFLK